MTRNGVIVVILCLFLTACGGSTRAPVSDRSLLKSETPTPNTYIVRKGDTLYSIAFRYGIEYRALARLNNIDQNYSIYPGQRLKLRSATVVTGNESIVSDKSINAPPVTIVRNTGTKAQTVSKPSSSVQKPKSEPASPQKVVHTKTKTAWKPQAGPIKWQWPASGKVIAYYKTKGTVNKGINISGGFGNAVKAAANGRVVYAGNGLLGYGNLVIVEHNQQFLSAYAHNSRVLVKENDKVKVGQKIAEMGNTGADRVMLHFEIRRDGKPMNPLQYLPKR
ncbi:MAG: peptidoglycan DD-metalloendopeptidase family protein [Neptuniibacter sp.]|uniref:peptidoglycan DD-metalloendopeptidase family protein n=1 Tax=Neptuniibacter sp. TaxID=1962643 RepID=UPI003B5B8034